MSESGLTLGVLALRLGCELRGDPERRVCAIATLDRAGPADLAFAVDRRFRERLAACEAGAILVPATLADVAPGDHLIAVDAYAAYACASWLLAPDDAAPAGVHPGAVIDAGATIAEDASIGPGAVVGAGTIVGGGAVLGAHVVVGRDCAIGARSRLFARVTLGDDVTLGPDCRLQSGAVIGSEGFGYARDTDGWQAIRQSGGVRVGARVHIGANTTVDRGAIEPTVIEDGVILDNQIQIAHNVRIGENTAIAGCTGIAGSTRIGRDCLIGGACDIVGHLEIADRVVINAASFVSRSLAEPGRYGSGPPLLPERQWRRTFAALGRLEELVRRVRRLEAISSPAARGARRPDGPSASRPTGED